MEQSTFNSAKNSLSNNNDTNNAVCRKYGNQMEETINDTTNNYLNFPSTVSSKWKPRLTLPALLPVLEQLRTTQNNISCNKKENNSPRSPQPSTPSYLSRSQSVASRCQASPDVLRDLSLRSWKIFLEF